MSEKKVKAALTVKISRPAQAKKSAKRMVRQNDRRAGERVSQIPPKKLYDPLDFN